MSLPKTLDSSHTYFEVGTTVWPEVMQPRNIFCQELRPGVNQLCDFCFFEEKNVCSIIV